MDVFVGIRTREVHSIEPSRHREKDTVLGPEETMLIPELYERAAPVVVMFTRPIYGIGGFDGTVRRVCNRPLEFARLERFADRILRMPVSNDRRFSVRPAMRNPLPHQHTYECVYKS